MSVVNKENHNSSVIPNSVTEFAFKGERFWTSNNLIKKVYWSSRSVRSPQKAENFDSIKTETWTKKLRVRPKVFGAATTWCGARAWRDGTARVELHH